MPNDADIPVNPLPTPAHGEVNEVTPATRATESSWAPHEGQLDEFSDEPGQLDQTGQRSEPERAKMRQAEDRPDFASAPKRSRRNRREG